MVATATAMALGATSDIRVNSHKATTKAPGAATRRTCKRELDALRAETLALTQQLARLYASHVGTRTSTGDDDAMRDAVDNALSARRKRKRAQDENRRLRMALRAQSIFVRQLRVLVNSDSNDSVLPDSDWCSYLHTYTRLPRDATVRRAEFSALTSEHRLRVAMETLVNDTKDMRVSEPTIRYQFTPRHDGLGATTIGAYALDTTDVSQALRAACVAIRDIAGVWPECSRTAWSRNVVDSNASASCRLQYSVDSARFQDCVGRELVLETRVATFYAELDGCGVVLWDFVDDDELFPLRDDVDIERCAIGGCLVRLEMCDDGVERVVCRTVCSKRYRWCRQADSHTSQIESQEATDRSRPSADVEQFLSSLQHATRPNGTVFREIVVQQVEEEAMLLAIAQSAC